MGKHKLERFAENKTFGNLFQHDDYDVRHTGFPMRGKWHEYFGNENPIILELGCGRGEYTIAMAKRFPDRNFIGIDLKGARIWRGCKDGIEQDIHNAAFIRAQIDEIEYFFGPGEVSEIWVTFPDPQPKKPSHRLVSPEFVARYRKIWGDKGIIHLKTDSRLMYEYLLETIPQQKWELLVNIEDVYYTPDAPELLTTVQTTYEKKWLAQGKMISYVEVAVEG